MDYLDLRTLRNWMSLRMFRTFRRTSLIWFEIGNIIWNWSYNQDGCELNDNKTFQYVEEFSWNICLWNVFYPRKTFWRIWMYFCSKKCILFKCILIKSALKNWNTFSKNPSYGCYRNVFWEKVVCTANDGEAQLKWISCQRLHSHCYSNYLFDIHHLPTYNNVKKNWNDENSTFD